MKPLASLLAIALIAVGWWLLKEPGVRSIAKDSEEKITKEQPFSVTIDSVKFSTTLDGTSPVSERHITYGMPFKLTTPYAKEILKAVVAYAKKQPQEQGKTFFHKVFNDSLTASASYVRDERKEIFVHLGEVVTFTVRNNVAISKASSLNRTGWKIKLVKKDKTWVVKEMEFTVAEDNR